MLIPRVLLAPSSPTLLIDERRGNSTAMLTALAEQAARLEADRPEVLVVVTSRWLSAGAFQVDDGKRHTSLIDMPGFGIEPRYDCKGEPALARAILGEARRAGLHAAAARRGADSGVTVPLHFLAAQRQATLVPVSISDLPAAAHREWGKCLRRAMSAWGGRSTLLVSGALTFHQHSFNMNREIAEDRDLDALALNALQSGEWAAIAERSARFPGKSHPETGWKHLEVLRGFLGGDVAGLVRAYEALPGIGEALVEFEVAPLKEAVTVATTGEVSEVAAADAAPAEAEPPATVAVPVPPKASPKPVRTTTTWIARKPGEAPTRRTRPSTPRTAGRSGARPARAWSPRSGASSGARPSKPWTPRPGAASTSRGPRPTSPRPGARPGARPSKPWTPRPGASSTSRGPRPASPRPGARPGARPSRPWTPRPGAASPSRGSRPPGPGARRGAPSRSPRSSSPRPTPPRSSPRPSSPRPRGPRPSS